MKFIRTLLLGAALIQTIAVSAQFEGSIYRTDGAYLSGVKLVMDGVEKKMAWSGGVNNPQFATPDLNKDGLNDLVIYEAFWLFEEKGIKTFINKGSTGNPSYFYAPEFEYLFPYVSRYIKMQDYNCDGVADLFHNGTAGVNICDGYYNADNALAFKNCRDIKFLYPQNTIPTYVSLGGSDIPAIVDVDGDGDLDVLSFSNMGNFIHWHKNVTKEKGFSCDTFAVQLRDVCWGKVLQNGPREHMLHYYCDNSIFDNQPKKTDGANTLCLLDHDGDGDLDILNGNSMFSDLQFMRNNKIQFGNSIDSMTWQDTTWQSGGKKLYLPRYPLATWIDADSDGDKDILVSPMAENSENYKCIHYYKNVGNDVSPNFAFQTDSFIVDRMLDLGSNSYPVFYDYDRDGKQDLFVGSRGFYQPNGKFKTTIGYFQNTTSGSDISFNLVARNFLSIDTISTEGASLAIGDLDNDGLDDLVVGRINGTMTYYRNFASSATVQPDWRVWQLELRDMNSTEIDAGNYAAPVIYDIDNDGKKDLIIGNETGYLYYYKNTGNVGQLSLQYITNKLGNVKVEPDQSFGYSAPFIGKMDNTNKEYLVVGTGFGRLYRYDGFQGNVSTAYSAIDTQYSNLRMPGKNLAPAFTDLNGDGKYEMVIGNDKGGLFFYRQVWNVNVDDVAQKDKIELYPNPAQSHLTIRCDGLMSSGKAEVRIYNSMGQLVTSESIARTVNTYTIDIAALNPGLYLCSVSYNGKVDVARFTKLK